MVETSARLLRLLSLLQTRRDWSGADLAARLEVTVRTVRRDVEKLRGLGYPVHAAPGVAGGYRLGAGAQLPPLLLDDDEAVAVAVGLRTAAGGTVVGIEETSVRALAKLEQVLPPRLRHRVSALESVMVPLARGAPRVDPDLLTVIAAACRDLQRLRFDYRRRDGPVSVRVTEPHRLVYTGRRWYLAAWDVDRGDWRSFRVDRIEKVWTPAGPRFEPREAPADIAGFTSWAVSNAAYRYRAKLRMHAPAAAVSEVVTPTSGVVEPEGELTSLLYVGSNSLDGMAVHISLLGFDFEVLEPAELVEHIRLMAGRLDRAAAASARTTVGAVQAAGLRSGAS